MKYDLLIIYLQYCCSVIITELKIDKVPTTVLENSTN